MQHYILAHLWEIESFVPFSIGVYSPFVFCGMPCRLVWFVFVGIGGHLGSSRWRIIGFSHVAPRQMRVMLNGVFYNSSSCKDPPVGSWLPSSVMSDIVCFKFVHLRMYSKVLWCLGRDTSIHTQTSPRSYAQRRLLLHFFLHTSYSWILFAKDCGEWGCVFQGMHLQICSEVLQCLRSNTFHIRTSSRSYTQWCLL